MTLGVACLLLAAKLEEPKKPNLRALLDDLYDQHNANFKEADLIDFESRLIVELEFGIRFATPLDFLGRF